MELGWSNKDKEWILKVKPDEKNFLGIRVRKCLKCSKDVSDTGFFCSDREQTIHKDCHQDWEYRRCWFKKSEHEHIFIDKIELEE